LLFANDVLAKRCGFTPFDKAVESAKIIFQGKAKKVDYFELRRESCGKKNVTFEVNKVWKGKIGNETTVFSNDGCLYLGGYFHEGKEYVVYGYEDSKNWYNLEPGTVFTRVCGRTHLLDHELINESLKDEIQRLDEYFKKEL